MKVLQILWEELISGKHINQHVHYFANPQEKELWLEFKERMLKKEYEGWLYSGSKGRPNDLGYWMGYQITKSYYDPTLDKQKQSMTFSTSKTQKNFFAKVSTRISSIEST